MLSLHNTITGEITSAPARSPIHHVSHIEKNLDHSANPAKLKLPTPNVALIIVGTKLRSANLATPAGVSKVLRPSDQRMSNHAPMTLSSVLPIAIVVEV